MQKKLAVETGNEAIMDCTHLLPNTEPMDYLAVDMPITFSPTVSRIMVPVTIINDLVDEEQEEFVAELELITVTNVTVAPREATVFIDDDDGE